MDMAQRHLRSTWIGSMTPSSAELRVGFPLQAFIYSTILPNILASPPFLIMTFIFLMGFLWKANHHNDSFPLPILQKKKDKIK